MQNAKPFSCEQPASIGRSMWDGGKLVTFLATRQETGGRFALTEYLIEAGQEPPVHVHDREDELFYVVEGAVDCVLDGRLVAAREGSSVLLPRGVPHTFHVRSTQARVLSFMTPAPAGRQPAQAQASGGAHQSLRRGRASGSCRSSA